MTKKKWNHIIYIYHIYSNLVIFIYIIFIKRASVYIKAERLPRSSARSQNRFSLASSKYQRESSCTNSCCRPFSCRCESRNSCCSSWQLGFKIWCHPNCFSSWAAWMTQNASKVFTTRRLGFMSSVSQSYHWIHCCTRWWKVATYRDHQDSIPASRP